MAKQYVQHISGQGEKWEVVSEDFFTSLFEWKVRMKSLQDDPFHWLPKSEYRLCPAPEAWKDVTEECVLDERGAVMHKGFNTFGDEKYRRRKVCLKTFGHAGGQWFVIIEQKVTE